MARAARFLSCRLSPLRPLSCRLLSQLLFYILLALLLAACAREGLEGEYAPVAPPPPPETRPEPPRVEPPAFHPAAAEGRLAAELRPFLNATLHLRNAGPSGIIVGTQERPFLVGERLGERLPLLTRAQLSLLAEPDPVLRGRPLRAERYVRFDFGEEGGLLTFGRDEETGRTRSSLLFPDGEPIFEYALLLHEGSLPALVGEPLAFFGHDYVVREAQNRSVTLYGLDTEQWLVLADKDPLEVNGQSLARTEVRVDPWSVAIRYYPGDPDEGGLALAPGESLRGRMRTPEALLNPLFDIIYEGLEEGSASLVQLEALRNRLLLRYTDALHGPVELAIASVENGSLRWGPPGAPLRRDCSGHCLALGDSFLVGDPVIAIMEYRSLNAQGSEAAFEELLTGESHLVRLAERGGRLDGAFLLGERRYSFTIENGSLDPGWPLDGRLRSSDGVELSLVENATGLHLALEQPRLPGLDAERLGLALLLEEGEPRVAIDGLALLEERDEEVWRGLSGRGTIVTLDGSEDGRVGERATLSYARGARSAIVRVVG